MSGRPTDRLSAMRRPLRILQANVGKGGASHDCALALADTGNYDIVLIQEPWTALRDGRCLTKTHTAYDTFSPVLIWEDNDSRPRVMTYVTRRGKLTAEQLRPIPSRDLLWIKASGITILNLYREQGTPEVLGHLERWTVPRDCLIGGDFNATHPTWQAGRGHGNGRMIAEWVERNDLTILNPPNVPTNPYGNTIDLAISNIPLAEATVEEHLATSSDHEALSISVPTMGPPTNQSNKIRVNKPEELETFAKLVASGERTLRWEFGSEEELDRSAQSLVDLLESSATAAGKRAKRGARAAPWWTEDCTSTHAVYRALRNTASSRDDEAVMEARNEFRRAVQAGKRNFWRTVIDGADSSDAMFKIAKWTQSKPPFQPPRSNTRTRSTRPRKIEPRSFVKRPWRGVC